MLYKQNGPSKREVMQMTPQQQLVHDVDVDRIGDGIDRLIDY